MTIVPGAAAGARARVVDPVTLLPIAGRVVTSTRRAAGTVDTKEEPAHTRVNVAGRIRLGSDPRTIYRRVANPSLFIGHTLKQLMERRGITVGAVKIGRAPAQGMRVLAAHDSAPLAVAVQELNKRSNTSPQSGCCAGSKIGGAPAAGTRVQGRRPLPDRHRHKTGSINLNGSGLYDSNRSAGRMVTILRAASHDFRISAEFMASLAVAGDGTSRTWAAPSRNPMSAPNRHAGGRPAASVRRLAGRARVLGHVDDTWRDRRAPRAVPEALVACFAGHAS